jgi:hypothetical protein
VKIVIEAAGRRVFGLQLWEPLHHSPSPGTGPPPAPDPHSTVAAHIEQADEPAPGFGFRGSAKTVIARMPGQ